MNLPMPAFVAAKGADKVPSISQIIQEMESDEFSFQICDWACQTFAKLTGIAMQNQHTELFEEFLDSGACENILSALNKHCSSSETLTASCCATLTHLAWSSTDLKDFLGEIGCCETVLYAISFHIGDPQVSEHGSAVIANLSFDHTENIFRLSEAGAIDIISQLGNFGFNLRNSQSADVAMNTCYSLGQQAEAINSSKLLECGAPELVINLLKVHRKNDHVVEAAVYAICSLASVNPQLREKCGEIESCEIIANILKKYDHIFNVVNKCCEAILHLSVSQNNLPKLIKFHAVELVFKNLETKLLDKPQGAEICLGAIINLLSYKNEKAFEMQKQKLIDMKIVEFINNKILTHHHHHHNHQNDMSDYNTNIITIRAIQLSNDLLAILGYSNAINIDKDDETKEEDDSTNNNDRNEEDGEFNHRLSCSSHDSRLPHNSQNNNDNNNHNHNNHHHQQRHPHNQHFQSKNNSRNQAYNNDNNSDSDSDEFNSKSSHVDETDDIFTNMYRSMKRSSIDLFGFSLKPSSTSAQHNDNNNTASSSTNKAIPSSSSSSSLVNFFNLSLPSPPTPPVASSSSSSSSSSLAQKSLKPIKPSTMNNKERDRALLRAYDSKMQLPPGFYDDDDD